MNARFRAWTRLSTNNVDAESSSPSPTPLPLGSTSGFRESILKSTLPCVLRWPLTIPNESNAATPTALLLPPAATGTLEIVPLPTLANIAVSSASLVAEIKPRAATVRGVLGPDDDDNDDTN